jgi:hypothetical protein
MTGDRRECARTRGLIDRIVAGSASDDDRRHAVSCPSCGAVMARAARFDNELERSARRLIAEDLPRGILDPGLSGKVHVVPRMPALAPGVTAGVAGLAIIVLVAVVGIRPVLLPGQTQTFPPFVQIEAPASSPLFSLAQLTGALDESLGYDCGGGDAQATPGSAEPGGASAICTAPPEAGPFTAAVTVDASATGQVVRVTITADIIGAQTQRERDAVATAMAKVTSEAFIGQGSAIRAANFVFAKASQLSGPAWAIGIDEGGVRVDLQRLADGGYIVHLSVAT